jgi:hypothetical protein
MRRFARTVGISYSGAMVPVQSLPGLRVYVCNAGSSPVEVAPPPSPRKYWNRFEIAEWLVERLSEDVPTLVGIAHGFSFPLRYFEAHGLPLDWPGFLDDFQRHWPTDSPYTYVDFIRDGSTGQGGLRMGNLGWRRLADRRAGRRHSLFQFDAPTSIAKATHAGLPWLRYLRHRLGRRVHFWPFDGWDIPPSRSVLAEVDPPRWRRAFGPGKGSLPQQDAFAVAAALARADSDGLLAGWLKPPLTTTERAVAEIEGWILGVDIWPSDDAVRRRAAKGATVH